MKLSYFIIFIIVLCCIASLISVFFIDLNNNKFENQLNKTVKLNVLSNSLNI